MRILGIETSCDEIAASVVEDGVHVVSSVIYSSLELEKKTGGVVPEVAARDAAEKIVPVIKRALEEAKCTKDDIDAIAVTKEPGLIGSLLVGIEAAHTLSFLWNKPLLSVNHIFGHICANLLEQQELPHFPVAVLTVSGGHNDLLLWKSFSDFEILGRTVDDAAGECFDKCARMLELPYPGGPHLSVLAESGNPNAFSFPRPMLNSGDANLSFSGLKTAVFYTLRDLGGIEQIDQNVRADLAASIEQAIVDTLLGKLFQSAKKYSVQEVHLAGGVSANKRLRFEFEKRAKEQGYTFRLPVSFVYSTDNAAMIAGAAFWMGKE